MENPLVSIIIANYNGESYLKICLNSVLASNYKKFETILVDDGSEDESLKIIELFSKKDKRISYIKNDRNIGAAASRNEAIKKANGQIILFLDNDTELEVSTISELVKTLKNENVGAAQALILEFKDRDKIQMAGGKFIPQLAWIIPYNQREIYKNIKDKLSPINIIAISACLAIKKSILLEIGSFDEKEAVHTEDLDLSWRIWISGNKIVLSPKAIVYHYTKSVEERSNMKLTFKKVYFHLTKNSFRSILKNYELRNLFKYLPISIFVNLGRGFLLLVTRKDASCLSGTIKGYLWSLKNLGDTLHQRKIVQKTRKFSDKLIMSKVFENKSLIDIYNQNFRHTKLLW